MSLGILISYLSIVPVTKTVTTKAPSFKHYLNLYAKYGTKFKCPCKTIAIEHKQFMQVTYTLHQVCSSNFITDNWLDFVSQYQYNLSGTDGTFQKTAPHMFQGLKLICQQVKDTITQHLSSFYSDRYVDIDVTAPDIFNYRTKSIFNQFQRSMTNEFLSALDLVRDMFQANALFSSLQTNAQLTYWTIANVYLADLVYLTTENEGL